MKTRAHLSLFLSLFGALALGGCGSISLAADVTPPPGYTPATPVPAADVMEVVAPTRPLNAGQGKVVYMENCASCHGEDGKGGGPQAGNLPGAVPSLVSPSVVAQAVPADWYRVTVAGRVEKSMPAFTGLTPGQIWDAIGYLYTLGTPPGTFTAGGRIFEQECASCHGPLGAGDGPAAASLPVMPADLSDPAGLMELSQIDLAAAISGGKGQAMPAFSAKLDPEQIQAAASYIRLLGFTRSADQAEAPLPEGDQTEQASRDDGPEETPAIGPDAVPAYASIRAVLSAPSGGELPAGLTASLSAYDAMRPVFTIDKKIGPDQSAQWDGIEARENRVYFVTVEHGGVTFRSPVIHGSDLKPGEVIPAPIEVFETSPDNSGLTAERVHIFFDFPSQDRVQVVQMFLIANPGPAMVIPAGEGGTVVDFNLPPGYTGLQFESGQLGGRYLQAPGGFGDTAGIEPGSASHQILFAYELPYQNSALVPVHMPLAVTNAILLVPGGGVKLEAEGLRDAGERTLQGGDMHMYALGNLPAGSTLQVKLSGLPGQAPALEAGSSTGLYIGGGALAAVMAGTAVWLFRRREEEGVENPPEEAGEKESVESLLDAIIALDDLHRAGRLPPAAYRDRRAELKERLRAARGE